MAKQAEQSIDRYNDIFPTTLRKLLESHPKGGHTTTYKMLGEAVGVRQQTISQYASGQTQPTIDVILKIAKFFDVSVDYLLTGVSSQNKDICDELGLSETAVQYLRRARNMYSLPNSEQAQTIPFLGEMLSDKDFYEFLEDLAHHVKQTRMAQSNAIKGQEDSGLDIEGYYIWQLQMFVEEFIRNELIKYGLKIELK